MTLITLDPVSISNGPTPWLNEDVILSLSPFAREPFGVEGSKLILPTPIKQVHSGGTFELKPTTDLWCWRINVESVNLHKQMTRYVAVPASGTVAWEDLVDVNPLTLDPAIVPEAAWTVALGQVRDRVEVLEDAPPGTGGGEDGQDGLSAYQIAVAEGFVGTQSAWIASLKGGKGDKGDPGDDGQDGTDGTDGINGSGFLLLAFGAAVPGGTPANTVIVRPSA